MMKSPSPGFSYGYTSNKPDRLLPIAGALAGCEPPCRTAWAGSRATALLVLGVVLATGCTSAKVLVYEGFGRDRYQQPDRVVSALSVQPGDHVADVGSGSGYFTVRLSRAVGSDGKVFAVDLDKKMNEYLRRRLERMGAQNVEIILGTADDPLLPDAAIDLVLTANTYHHIENRQAYFRNLKRDLSPGGRVAIIDYDGRKFMRLLGHYTPLRVILREMAEAGYEVAESYYFLDRQSFVIFRPVPDDPSANR